MTEYVYLVWSGNVCYNENGMEEITGCWDETLQRAFSTFESATRWADQFASSRTRIHKKLETTTSIELLRGKEAGKKIVEDAREKDDDPQNDPRTSFYDFLPPDLEEYDYLVYAPAGNTGCIIRTMEVF